MYQAHYHGKNKYTGIAQTGRGWNTSTWTIINNGRTVRWHKSRNFRTLAEAKREYAIQKRRFKDRDATMERRIEKKARGLHQKKRRNNNPFGINLNDFQIKF